MYCACPRPCSVHAAPRPARITPHAVPAACMQAGARPPAAAANPAAKRAAAGKTAVASSSTATALSGQRSVSSGATSLTERRQGWAKTGIIAMRDMGLTALQADAFTGDERLGWWGGGVWARYPSRITCTGSHNHPTTSHATPHTPPPRTLAGLEAARSADLSCNRLTALPPSLGTLTALQSLRLSSNALTQGGLPWDALASLSALSALDLSSNQLSALPAAAGAALPALVRLSLAGNCLVALEAGCLSGLARLQELQLGGNQLATLPECIGAP